MSLMQPKISVHRKTNGQLYRKLTRQLVASNAHSASRDAKVTHLG